MSEIIFENGLKFSVFDEVYALYPNEENSSLVLEMDNMFFHLGEKPPTLQTILDFLEKHNNLKFSSEELEMIAEENEAFDGR